jgi:hypothetical protein
VPGGASKPPGKPRSIVESALLHLPPENHPIPPKTAPQTTPRSWAKIPLTYNCLFRIFISPESEFLSINSDFSGSHPFRPSPSAAEMKKGYRERAAQNR